jgi:GNAT superfamily N-acetyltransferase
MNGADGIIARKATPADAAELARLRWDFREADHAGHSRAEFVRECEAWLRAALASDRWMAAVADARSDALCGCMFLQYVEKVPAPGSMHRQWGYVTNAFVDPELRSRGIGQKLLQLLIDAPGIAARNSCWSGQVSQRVRFYRRAGFLPLADASEGAGDEPPLQLTL